MTWYMNFCAPFIPNDPTINFHRLAQTLLFLLYTLAYAVLHTYYKYCASPAPAAQPQPQQQHAKSEEESSSSENSSDKDKEVSIKIEEHPNDSCLELKKTGTTNWEQNTTKKGEKSDKDGKSIPECVTLAEIESYFPIVYGHFAVAMTLSIMYTPYAEQTIAALVYELLTIPLVLFNSKRFPKWTNFFWIVMALLLLFVITCGLLEVGQSNWDIINLTCFSTQYISLYD